MQVRKGKYPESDSDEAVKAGEKATTQIGKDGTDKGRIFRFNPGKQGKTKMLTTERAIIEIKTSSKDEVVAEIAEALEKHPDSLRLDFRKNFN